MMIPSFSLRHIADAIARSAGKASLPGDTVFQRCKAQAQTGVLVGHKPAGAGRTTARRFDRQEAAFACILDVLRDFGIDGERAREMRIGFFTADTETALTKMRGGIDWTLTLDFSYRGGAEITPSIRCALHRTGDAPDWSPYSLETRGRPLLGEASERLFLAEWSVTGIVRPFLFSLEPDE